MDFMAGRLGLLLAPGSTSAQKQPARPATLVGACPGPDQCVQCPRLQPTPEKTKEKEKQKEKQKEKAESPASASGKETDLAVLTSWDVRCWKQGHQWRLGASSAVLAFENQIAFWLGGSVSNLVSRGLFVESSCTVEICIRRLKRPQPGSVNSDLASPILLRPVSILKTFVPQRFQHHGSTTDDSSGSEGCRLIRIFQESCLELIHYFIRVLQTVWFMERLRQFDESCGSSVEKQTPILNLVDV
ncbi:hypothetical protein NA56DRAFT_750762 [Hyaloscypha hepaticicola]|uniref:Uncharacterized protein n=1 Tax=Hyaloscypha hepaticicola TaxID=2082293 RepID=A0A2J6PZ42_9HELO|nr:hypothetical protein NA56DRAFT_750762 [Hyaloscypha hepaticicola]